MLAPSPTDAPVSPPFWVAPYCSCRQVLEHISCVWDVAFGADGDLVTASGDAVAYVWTAEAARKVGHFSA